MGLLCSLFLSLKAGGMLECEGLFIVSRNASPGQRRWECLNMRTLADPVLGWKGGMRPVIKFSTPGEEF
jgi:hypothetical protein